MNEALGKRGMAGVLVCVILLIACGIMYLPGLKRTPVAATGVVDGRYYTADEGTTWVADSWALAPPFEKDGKTWVRVWLFTFDGKTPIPGYLEKFTPEAVGAIDAQENHAVKQTLIEMHEQTSLLVKRVGGSGEAWVAKDSDEGIAVIAAPVDAATGKRAWPMIPDVAKR